MIGRLRLTLTTALVAAATSTASADLIITEVVDATLPGGLPKYVELTNTGGTTVDLSAYSIGNFNNGGTDLGGGASSGLSGQLTTCDSYVIAYETAPVDPATSLFFDVYGFEPDIYLGPFVNGDDVIALFQGLATGDGSDATLVDIYGEIGVDGTGMPWEYMDSYATRDPDSVTASTTWNAADWFVPGPNALETGDDVEELALILANTTPGTHECTPPVPTEPASWGEIKATYR